VQPAQGLAPARRLGDVEARPLEQQPDQGPDVDFIVDYEDR
jgi:hypothetical protein